MRRRYVLSNPAADFSPRLDAGGIERPRSRALGFDELARLFAAIRGTPNFGEDNLLAIKLLLALCARKSELLGARWAEFDLHGETPTGAVWHLPASRTKTILVVLAGRIQFLNQPDQASAIEVSQSRAC